MWRSALWRLALGRRQGRRVLRGGRRVKAPWQYGGSRLSAVCAAGACARAGAAEWMVTDHHLGVGRDGGPLTLRGKGVGVLCIGGCMQAAHVFCPQAGV